MEKSCFNRAEVGELTNDTIGLRGVLGLYMSFQIAKMGIPSHTGIFKVPVIK